MIYYILKTRCIGGFKKRIQVLLQKQNGVSWCMHATRFGFLKMWRCGDVYCYPYTYCMPILAARIKLSSSNVLSLGWDFYRAYTVIGDNTSQSLPHVLSTHLVEKEKHYIFLSIAGNSEFIWLFSTVLLKNLNNHIYNVKFIHLLMYFLPTRRSRKAIFKQSFEDY